MKEYILKRFLLIIVTLLGISIITFVITRLAPGDPFSKEKSVLSQQGSQALTEENIRQNRKIYGFDKPLVLNFRFDDRDTNVKRLLKEYKKASDLRKKSIIEELHEIGTIAIPQYINNLSDHVLSNISLRMLEKINFDNHPVRRLRKQLLSVYSFWDFLNKSKKERIKYWKQWWKNNSHQYYNEEKIKKVVLRYIRSGKNIKPVLHYGGLSVKYIIEYIESDNIKYVIRATKSLAKILKKSWIVEKNMSSGDRKRMLYRWNSWWDYNEERFIEYPWYRDLYRIFTNAQYGIWLRKIITFDFDESYTYKRPVLELIGERLPISVQLSLLSIILTYMLSIPIGIFSATHQNKISDKITTVSLFILYSLPSFWVASMLILFLTGGGNFPNLFPARYLHSIGAENFSFVHYVLDWLWHLVLPVFCLTYGSLAYLSRQMRVGMLDVIRQDYIKTARAKGLSEKLVVYKHALKNALIPIITILSAILPALIGGSIIIEEIFSIDGMGRLAFEAILNRDYPIINAIAFFSAFLTLTGILLADILYAIVDPRIKFKGSRV